MGTLALELAVHPDDTGRLRRRAEFAQQRDAADADAARRRIATGARPRAVPVAILWHDGPDGELAARGLVLARTTERTATRWDLQYLSPGRPGAWQPGTPPRTVASAPDPARLAHPVPTPLIPLAGFSGQTRTLAAAAIGASLLEGTIRTATVEAPLTRLYLSGPAAQVADLALRLARDLRLSVPPRGMAAEACLLAPVPPPAPHLGPPRLAPGLTVGEALALVLGQLAGTLLHWAPAAHDGTSDEPVHQMRVAMRRLRSAVPLFRRAADCPMLAEATTELKVLGRALGPARDWDVFARGTGRALAAALPDDPDVARLLAAAERRRQDCYQRLRVALDGPAFRRLGLLLSVLAAAEPWAWPDPAPPNGALAATEGAAEVPAPADDAAVWLIPPTDAGAPDPRDAAADAMEAAERRAAALAMPLEAYAARALARRMRPMLDAGTEIADLPTEALHAIRLHGKRLRYAAEFFAPLFPRRGANRFIRRLSVLQERLGQLNDGAVAAALMAQLGPAQGGRGYAGGLVRGFVAARAHGVRGRIDRGWRKFHKLEPFWT